MALAWGSDNFAAGSAADPEKTGKNGARLLLQVIEAARAGGAVHLFLEVRRSNEQAIGFYRRFGFVRIGVRRGYYRSAAGREDALVFDKELR